MFETDGIGQTPNSLERCLVCGIFCENGVEINCAVFPDMSLFDTVAE